MNGKPGGEERSETNVLPAGGFRKVGQTVWGKLMFGVIKKGPEEMLDR